MDSESSNSGSTADQMSREMKKLKFFKIEHPKGGQYNDGFTLVAEFKHSYDNDLICLLKELGVTPVLLDVEPPPPQQYPDPTYEEIQIDGVSKWLQDVGYCKIDGEWFYISYGRGGLRIVANGGYEVDLSDVIRAINIEKNMRSEFFLPRIYE